jgi:ABC-type nitrate/sulfonate/bicarbonate transport system permease component
VFAPNKWRVFWTIKLPEAIPQICEGARVGVTFAIVGVIVGEMIRPSSGLGYIIEEAKQDDKVEFEFAAILLVSVMGALLYWFVQLVENSKWLHRFRFLPAYSKDNEAHSSIYGSSAQAE